MNKLIISFKDKRIRYGAFSTVMIVFAVAVLIAVNLVVSQLSVKFDMTKERLYSISEETKKILSELTTDVVVYTLYRTGSEHFMYTQILDQYQSASSRVRIENKDPYLYPAFVAKYAEEGQTIPSGSVIIESKYRYKVVLAEELTSRELNMETWQYQTTSIDIEPRVTNGIYYVNQESTPTVYILEGHGEIQPPEKLTAQMTVANFDVKTIDILDEDIPEDCAVLFISTPTSSDWAPEEAEKIREYLGSNGRALFIISYTMLDTPVLDGVLYSYGVVVGDYFIIEGNPNNFISNIPYYLRPDFTDSEIVAELISRGDRPLLYPASSVVGADMKKNSVKVEPLLTTSKTAYGRVDPNIETINKHAADLDGPFDLAVAVTDSEYYGNAQYICKLVLIPCVMIMDESMNAGVRGANWNFIINSLNWLQDKTDSVYVRAKSPTTSVGVLTIESRSAAMSIAVVCAVVIPLAIVAAGLFVWLRRRHA